MKSKKVLFLILMFFVLSVSTVYAQAVTIMSKDGTPQGVDMVDGQIKPYSVGQYTKVYWNDHNSDGTPDDTDGNWQKVVLPSGEKCKTVLIQVTSGSTTVYDPSTANAGFLYSHESGGNHVVVDIIGIVISIGKQVSDGSTVLGWVKAATGQKLAIMLLY